MLKRVMTAVLQRPGAKARLSQVLPILRQMTAPQRLALASLVMAQVMADPNDPTPMIPKSMDNATTQLMLPISMDIANMFKGLAREQATGRSSAYVSEIYHQGRLRPASVPSFRRPPQSMSGINRRNANVHIDKLGSRPRPGRPLRKPLGSKLQTCTKVTNNLCLETNDYPEELILSSIKSDGHPGRFGIFMSEPRQELESELQRRKSDQTSDSATKGLMCQTRIELARPKKARATSGQWKFIVNTDEYTQTLRLEICSKPQGSCHYLRDEIESQCVQVYNYHRLLTWDEKNGLTVDVFKVPTCCSCRVLGYKSGNHYSHMIPEKTSPAPPSEHIDSNLVSNDESLTAVRIPIIPPQPPGNRGYTPPKRDSGRRPIVQHRGPPLPLEGEVPHEEIRYPPLENTLRRTTRNNTVDRIRFKPTLNSRHPALPIDSLNADTMGVPTVSTASRPTLPPPKRINYSYHPIIDYFRPQEQEARAESRIGFDWTPITGGDSPRRY
ncbi:unnamed protein product [Nezara viridula]|uniref:Protein spaetzle n=2 Tax=Nezara viridula TaxID=85310 RepID=A0A9P0HFS2_NEZVI|nr:unnamed protein product [Nezara viridula]